MPEAKQLYEFTEAGFFAGTHYAVGDRISLYPAQVKYDGHRMTAVADEPSTPLAAGSPEGSRKRQAKSAE